MKKEHICTSEEILNTDELYDIQELVCSHGESIEYELTEDENQWLDFVRGRYSIADYIDGNTEDGIFTIDNDVSRVMDDDCGGMGKAVCLSDHTALQRILFWVYSEEN